jgi:glycosyltransferase involved in cell wall biosynthesis
MKNKPKVSYILAILNGIATIKDCLGSVINQQHDYPYEVLVLDGGSTDGTLNVIKDFARKYSQVKLIHNPHKLSEGKGNGKDMGVSLAKGNYLVFLDHDNILLHKDWLKIMLRPMEEDKSIMATQSLLRYRKGDSPFLKYINALGVEDPFAVDYSLVSQVVLLIRCRVGVCQGKVRLR